MGDRTRHIDVHEDHMGNNILNSNLNQDEIQFLFFDIEEAGQSYDLTSNARFPFIVKSLTVSSDVGTIAVTVSINGNAIDGLTWVEAVYAGITANSTGNNVVEKGDKVVLDIAELTGSPTKLIGNLEIYRT